MLKINSEKSKNNKIKTKLQRANDNYLFCVLNLPTFASFGILIPIGNRSTNWLDDGVCFFNIHVFSNELKDLLNVFFSIDAQFVDLPNHYQVGEEANIVGGANSNFLLLRSKAKF
jgi:ABC-type amino acid transport system permease subunit